MRRLLIGIVVLILVGFLVRMLAIGSNITAANDVATLGTLKPPTGFVDAIGEPGCPQFEFCFRTSGLLQPMTPQNATSLIRQFGLAVSNINCQTGNSGLTCTGNGTMMGVNRLTDVFFSALSGSDINSDSSSAPQISSGTYVAFGTKALKRLPLTARLQ